MLAKTAGLGATSGKASVHGAALGSAAGMVGVIFQMAAMAKSGLKGQLVMYVLQLLPGGSTLDRPPPQPQLHHLQQRRAVVVVATQVPGALGAVAQKG